ncbi:class F sortase [Blastococcus sp. MG754426]|uniref:class F sortase n=1 Tax=unclassified Blastococcus TaxID=2619396 RepID=UPI001EF1506C|nr:MULTISPECIES: class F sortase [unclassified Blastococcus]MCF6508870.1 class F sortase [Blastococcus sp. MG754426]MCF6512336.1 class F sortase [Blastococcus sp. MG754427]MCF6734192.1 class F sortase [Blastococcus sp. KM273129]
MTEQDTRRPSPRRWVALAAGLALVAVVAVVVAVTGQRQAPQPAVAGGPAPAAPSSASAPAGPQAPAAGPPADSVAEPVSVRVPAIDVTSDLLRLGLDDDGAVEVPPLGPDDRAGWYERGPAPGAVGPAVLLGHVDSAEHGPGVFFDLGALQPGDEIEVARADGTVAVFAVDRVERHAKDDFPTLEVYGDTLDAQLRLITCGGDFDSSARSYEDNVIAFATLVGTRAA